nr:hypothetical protein [Tanacetum cinerariifolium]
MVELMNQRRKAIAEMKDKAKRDKPITLTQQKEFMRTFVKNQSSAIYTTGWTWKDVRGLTDDQLQIVYDKIRRAVDLATAKDHHQQLKRSAETLESSNSKKLKSSHNTTQLAELQEPTSVFAGAPIPAITSIPAVTSVLDGSSIPAVTPSAAGASGSTSDAYVLIIKLLDSPPKDTSIPLDSETEEQDATLRKPSRKKSIARRRSLPSAYKPKSDALPFNEDDPEAEFKRYLRQASDLSLSLLPWFSTLRELMYWAGRDDLMVLYGLVSDKYKTERATDIAGDIMYMFVDKKYPLTPETIQRMLNHGLKIDRDPSDLLKVCRALTMPAWVLNCPAFKLEEIVMAMMTCLKSSGVHYQCFTVKCGLLCYDDLLKVIRLLTLADFLGFTSPRNCLFIKDLTKPSRGDSKMFMVLQAPNVVVDTSCCSTLNPHTALMTIYYWKLDNKQVTIQFRGGLLGIVIPAARVLCSCWQVFISAGVLFLLVMVALVISTSSNVSVESVGSFFLRVILIGSISVEVPVASEVGAAVVSSPVRVLELDTHLSSKVDPSESSPPPAYVTPMVLAFLCSNDLELDTEIPKRHALTMRKSVRPLPSHCSELSLGHSSSGHSLSGHTPLDINDADSSTPSRFVRPPIAKTPRCSEAYLRWRSTTLSTMYPSMTFESSVGDSSSESSAGPSCKRCRSLAATVISSINATRALVRSRADLPQPRKRFRDSILPEDSVEEDLNTNVLEDIVADATTVEVVVDMDVEARINVGIGIEVDVGIDVEDEVEDEVKSSDRGTIKVGVDVVSEIGIPNVIRLLDRKEDIEMGQRELEARSLIAGGERASLLEQVASLERNNARLPGTMMMERARADRFRRRVRFIESELRGQVVNQRVVTCFEYGRKGHYSSDCPMLKDQNRRNKVRNKNGVGEARGKAYVLGGGDANPDSNAIKGTFLLNYYAFVLFDSGVEQNFVLTTFSTLLYINPDTLNVSYAVELADGRVSKTNTILRGYTLGLLGHPFNIDLRPVQLGSFDVIIGTDWLSNHHTKETVDKSKDNRLEDVLTIRDYPEVFPEDVPGLSHMRQVEFQIELVLGVVHVARAPYRLAPVKEEDTPKIVFRIRYGHNEFQVMPFGLTNAPTVFIDQMNRVCKPYLVKFMIVFIDDILIYSKSKEEYVEHLKSVLELLKKEELYTKFSKYNFWLSREQFLSHMIDSEGIYIAKPMMKLTQKNGKFDWSEKEEAAFQLLKQKLCAVLMQGEKGIAYASHQLKIHKKNYTTHDLELGATSTGQDTIWVVVDRLTKSAHFLPMKETDSMEKLMRKYLKDVVSRYRVPVLIISNRDSKFTSHFWQSLNKALGKVWDRHLPLVEFYYNNSYHTIIKVAPFEALYGQKCRSPICWAEVGDAQLTSLEIFHERTEKIIQIKKRIVGNYMI